MANKNMTIRFTPDGFSFAECPNSASIILDEAPFHDIAPGPDFQSRLHEALLDALPQDGGLLDLTCQVVSTRVVILPPDITDLEQASLMYRSTLCEPTAPEEVMLQPLTLPTGQEVMLCFGFDHELLCFLQRNFGELSFEHHLATLLIEGARMANGNCLVVRCDAQFLELALFRQKRLQLINVYRTSRAENRSFYVMNTWIQEELDQLTDYLLVLGSSTECLQVRASLHRFIKHVYA